MKYIALILVIILLFSCKPYEQFGYWAHNTEPKLNTWTGYDSQKKCIMEMYQNELAITIKIFGYTDTLHSISSIDPYVRLNTLNTYVKSYIDWEYPNKSFLIITAYKVRNPYLYDYFVNPIDMDFRVNELIFHVKSH